MEGRPGSVNGLPGVILKKVMSNTTADGSEKGEGGEVVIEEKPVQSGLVDEIFIAPRDIQPDPRIEVIRSINPAAFEQ